MNMIRNIISTFNLFSSFVIFFMGSLLSAILFSFFSLMHDFTFLDICILSSSCEKISIVPQNVLIMKKDEAVVFSPSFGANIMIDLLKFQTSSVVTLPHNLRVAFLLLARWKRDYHYSLARLENNTLIAFLGVVERQGIKGHLKFLIAS